MPRSSGGFKLLGNLRVQDPKLALKRGRLIYREGRTARHFRHEFDVVVGLFQQRTNFVSERGFAHAVRANQGKFQGLGYLERIFFNTTFILAQITSSLSVWLRGRTATVRLISARH